MSEQINTTPESSNSNAQELSRFLEICEQALVNHYAAEILNSEFPSNQSLLMPHLNNSWTALEALRDFIFSESPISDIKQIKKREHLQKKYSELNNQFKELSEEFSKISFPSSKDISRQLSQKLESHLNQLGLFCSETNKFILCLSGWKPVYKRSWFIFILAFCTIILLGSLSYRLYKNSLTGFKVVKVNQGWGALNTNRSVEGNKLRVAGVVCEHGLGTHAKSEIVLEIKPGKNTLEGICGIDDEVRQAGSIQCEIKQDQKTLFQSQILKGSVRSQSFSVNINATLPVTLLVSDAGDGITSDHADWCRLTAK